MATALATRCWFALAICGLSPAQSYGNSTEPEMSHARSAGSTTLSTASTANLAERSIVLATSTWGGDQCASCTGLTKGLLGVGTLAACYNKCSTQAGTGRIFWCNVLCNLVVHGGCSKYGLNCAQGVCRAAGRCSSNPWSMSLTDGSLANMTSLSFAGGELEASAQAGAVVPAETLVALATGGWPDDQACASCQGLTNGLIGVGTFAACYSKCSQQPSGNGRIFWCNVLCNLVVHGGCSKYGLNCARGLCRAAGRCSSNPWALAAADGNESSSLMRLDGRMSAP